MNSSLDYPVINSIKKPDSELIFETVRGNVNSFGEIVKKYQRQIHHHVLHILNDEDLAKDAVQETFVRAFKKIRQFKSNKPFGPWLYKIATNYCYDWLRKNSRLTSLSDKLESKESSILDSIVKEEQKSEVIREIKNLPEIYRLPIIGYYFRQLDYRELSKELKIPVNTLRTRLKRGKNLLSKSIKIYDKFI